MTLSARDTLAEVILNRAEALARLQPVGGSGGVNTTGRVCAPVWRRTRWAPRSPTKQQALLDAIWEERRLELAFEGFRWPDLVPTGRAVSVLGIQNRAHQVLYPIPQAERDVTTPTAGAESWLLTVAVSYEFLARKRRAGVFSLSFHPLSARQAARLALIAE